MSLTAVGVTVDVQATSTPIIISPIPNKSSLTIDIVNDSVGRRTLDSRWSLGSFLIEEVEVDQAILLPGRGVDGPGDFCLSGRIPNRKRVTFVRLTNRSYRIMVAR